MMWGMERSIGLWAATQLHISSATANSRLADGLDMHIFVPFIFEISHGSLILGLPYRPAIIRLPKRTVPAPNATALAKSARHSQWTAVSRSLCMALNVNHGP